MLDPQNLFIMYPLTIFHFLQPPAPDNYFTHCCDQNAFYLQGI